MNTALSPALHNTLLFATRSEDKVRELIPIMSALQFQVISLREAGIVDHGDEDRIEVFDTFEANALAKARWFFTVSNGMPVLADDSGLEVHALDGRPGVRSKRWSGRGDLHGPALDAANNAFLMQALRERDGDQSLDREHAFPFSAQYVCAAACVWSGGACVVRGVTTGSIVANARGDGGFGYDPHFHSDELGITFGEADRDAKGRMSHRGRAFRALVRSLQSESVFAGPGS